MIDSKHWHCHGKTVQLAWVAPWNLAALQGRNHPSPAHLALNLWLEQALEHLTHIPQLGLSISLPRHSVAEQPVASGPLSEILLGKLARMHSLLLSSLCPGVSSSWRLVFDVLPQPHQGVVLVQYGVVSCAPRAQPPELPLRLPRALSPLEACSAIPLPPLAVGPRPLFASLESSLNPCFFSLQLQFGFLSLL